MTDNTLVAPDAPSPVGAVYVQPSAEQTLRPGERIAHLFTLNETQPYVLQRLTERTYWFQAGHYATTFFVGDEGVLAFDPLHERTERLLTAISSVTHLPIKTIVYSHDHRDHIGEAAIIMKAMAERGESVEIVTSQATAEKQLWRRSKLPGATKILPWPQADFTFEDLHLELHGFERAAHCDDSSAYLLVEEKVLHAADHSNPDELPFWKFSANENFLYFEANLRQTEQLDWVYENGGHGNVGYKEERAFYYEYIRDLTEAVDFAMERITFNTARAELAGRPHMNSHTAFHTTWTRMVADAAVDTMRAKYGPFYGFEYGTWSNAEQIVWARFAYESWD
jgi:glyoxylase-like metal-dependent hydrolase (beta-lactamase superfamily II)